MRLIQVLIPEGARESVLEALDEDGIDYAVFDEVGRGDFEAMVQFPVPPSGVELVSVSVDYRPIDLLVGTEPRVDILVGIPRDVEAPPDLAQRWDDDLTEQFDRDLVVRVGFIEAQVSEGNAPAQQTQRPRIPQANGIGPG